MPTILLPVLADFGRSLINKIWPDPAQQAEAQRKLLELQQNGELETMRIQLSAILAEAQSADGYTSRARPTFLYVMYIMILLAVPTALVSVFKPEAATHFATGMGAFLNAIPDSLWALFGAGYLGYTGVRSWEKSKGFAK